MNTKMGTQSIKGLTGPDQCFNKGLGRDVDSRCISQSSNEARSATEVMMPSGKLDAARETGMVTPGTVCAGKIYEADSINEVDHRRVEDKKAPPSDYSVLAEARKPDAELMREKAISQTCLSTASQPPDFSVARGGLTANNPAEDLENSNLLIGQTNQATAAVGMSKPLNPETVGWAGIGSNNEVIRGNVPAFSRQHELAVDRRKNLFTQLDIVWNNGGLGSQHHIDSQSSFSIGERRKPISGTCDEYHGVMPSRDASVIPNLASHGIGSNNEVIRGNVPAFSRQHELAVDRRKNLFTQLDIVWNNGGLGSQHHIDSQSSFSIGERRKPISGTCDEYHGVMPSRDASVIPNLASHGIGSNNEVIRGNVPAFSRQHELAVDRRNNLFTQLDIVWNDGGLGSQHPIDGQSSSSIGERRKPISGTYEDYHGVMPSRDASVIPNLASHDDINGPESESRCITEVDKVVSVDEVKNGSLNTMEQEDDGKSVPSDLPTSPMYTMAEKWIMDQQKKKLLNDQNWNLKQQKTEKRIATCFDKVAVLDKMASSPIFGTEAVELLNTCIKESGDDSVLASKLNKMLQRMKSCGREHYLSYHIISRAREDFINQHALKLRHLPLPMRGGTESGIIEGYLSETSKGGPLSPSQPRIGPNSTNDYYYVSHQSDDEDSRSAKSQSQENHDSANWGRQLNDEDGKKGTIKRKKVDISVVEPPSDNTHRLNTPNPLVSTIAADEDGPTHKLKSEVWNHFKKEKIDEAMKAICNYCGKMLGGESKNGTKHLHHHWKVCSSRKQRDITQSRFKSGKANDGNVVCNTYTFDSEVSRRDLASMIILHEYPLTMVEHKGFRKFLNSLQPSFKIVSRRTIQKDIFDIYEKERYETMKMLESNRSRIAIAVDMWMTGDQKKEYMAITAHFIDESWNLLSRTIGFACVSCPYTADTLFDVLMECLLDWNIDTKLSTLVVDTADTVMAQKLLYKLDLRAELLHRDLFHIGRCAYFLNFMANDALMEIGENIKRIRDSVAYWIATPQRLERFRSAACHLEISYIEELVIDCTIGWNSTFFMLKSALKYEKVFSYLRQHEIQYTSLPLENDWILVTEMCDKLEVFYNTIQSLSRTKYPTLNMLFSEIFDIRLKLSKWLHSELREIRVIAHKLIRSFEEYWGLTRSCLTIATILDPRFKMRLIEFYFSQIYEDQYYLEIERVRALCEELVKCYRLNSSITIESSSSSTSSWRQDVDNFVRKKDRLLQFDEFVSTIASTVSVKVELDIYLRESLVPRSDDFDILTWWKLNGTRYPTLYQIAKDIFAIPITSVAPKLAFGHGGRQISQQLSNLHPKLLEALMCTQNWLWAKETPDDRGSASLFADVDLD